MLMEMEQEGVSTMSVLSVLGRAGVGGRKVAALLSPTHSSILVSLVA